MTDTNHSTAPENWPELEQKLVAEIEALRSLVEERTAAAEKLWALLDDIDTLDDSCREHDDLFRERTRLRQQKRFQIIHTNGNDFVWPARKA